MLALIQRVSNAKVTVKSKVVSQIDKGILLLCGFEAHDTLENSLKLIEKCTKYRIFPDQDDKMNLSLNDINAAMLIVPQFTLAANTEKGLRPSFSSALPPSHASILFEELKKKLSNIKPNFAYGVFSADMDVALCNHGPATFILKN